MIELLKSDRIWLEEIKREAQKDINDGSMVGFELNSMLLQIIESNRRYKRIKTMETMKDMNCKQLTVYGAKMQDGFMKTVKCSNLVFKITT
jgi:hypothetical protein